MKHIWWMAASLFIFSGENLSPQQWDLEKLRKADEASWEAIPLTQGSKAMVVTTSFGGTAVQAGFEALERGGGAVDAALTTAFTQISLNMGSWSSYAGIMTLVYFEASSGKVYSLQGGWKIPAQEKDAMSIPISKERNERGMPLPGKRTGRGILVPGFMASAEAAHRKFGKLDWAQLWQPAIYFAEEGVPFNPMHKFLINSKKDVLQRFPRTWRIFTKEDGTPYAEGDTFKQTALAKTLRGVAESGAQYMYTGPWARELVAAVQAEGGNLSLEDLKNYKPQWRDPVRGVYGSYEITGCGFPNMGGTHAVEAFHLLGLAKPAQNGPYWENGMDLFNMIQISKMAAILTLAPQRYGFEPEKLFGAGNFKPAGRLKRQTAETMWQRMKRPDWSQALRTHLQKIPKSGSHSDSVLAIDEKGNVVALTHSINVANWGNSGIFVGGIGISDAGRYQRASLAKAGAGNHLPEATNPLIILENGKPVMASGAVGRALHEVTLQNLVGMMDLNMNPRAAVDAPKFLTPQYDPNAKIPETYHIQRLIDRGFSEKVLSELKAMGQDVYLQKPNDFKAMGYWLGLRINSQKGLIEASGAMGGARGY